VLARSQATIEGFCNKIHKTLLKQLKYANVWGSSAKHRPQKVGKDHGLNDEDIVQVGDRQGLQGVGGLPCQPVVQQGKALAADSRQGPWTDS
jgi:hypothetical protein